VFIGLMADVMFRRHGSFQPVARAAAIGTSATPAATITVNRTADAVADAELIADPLPPRRTIAGTIAASDLRGERP
jgi:hypothetical protein